VYVETDELGAFIKTRDLNHTVLLEVEALQVGEHVEVLYLLEALAVEIELLVELCRSVVRLPVSLELILDPLESHSGSAVFVLLFCGVASVG